MAGLLLVWGCKILCENLWWLWARQEQPILTLSANFARRGDSLLAVVRGLLLPPAVGPGCLLHPFAACSAAGEQRNILSPRQVPPAAVALRNAPAGAALCAPAVFAPRFARLRGDSLLVVGQGYYLHPFAACSAASEQRNILALRSGCFCTALRAIARQ